MPKAMDFGDATERNSRAVYISLSRRSDHDAKAMDFGDAFGTR